MKNKKKEEKQKKWCVFICRGTCFLTRHIKKALIKEEEKKIYGLYSFFYFLFGHRNNPFVRVNLKKRKEEGGKKN